MPITSLLETTICDSQQVAVIAASFDEVLDRLGIRRGTNPDQEELIAGRLIAAANEGAVERQRLVTETLSKIG